MSLYTETDGRLIIPPPSHISYTSWPRREFVSRTGQSCWEGLADYVDSLKVKLSVTQRRFEYLRDHPNQTQENKKAQARFLKERTHLAMCLDHYELVLSKQTKRSSDLALKHAATAATMARENREYISEHYKAIKKFDKCRGHIKANREAISRNQLAIRGFIDNAHRQSAIAHQVEQNSDAIVSYAKTLQGVQRNVAELKQLLNARPVQKVKPPPPREEPWNASGYRPPDLAGTYILDRE